MTICQFCGADVADLGNHFGGYQCAPCPEVAGAFGPDTPRNRRAEQDGYPLPDEYAARGLFGQALTRAEIRVRQRELGRKYKARRRQALAAEGIL